LMRSEGRPPTLLAGSLATGAQASHSTLSAFRPTGLLEWVVVFNMGGRAYFRYGPEIYYGQRCDVMLMKPYTPQDYGLDEQTGYWKNAWAHFNPRPHWLAWLNWPELAPGLMHIRFDHTDFLRLEQVLIDLDLSHYGTSLVAAELAMNALERALLLCTDALPKEGALNRDVRIERTLTYILRHLSEKLSVSSLADVAQLSRSHFTSKFRESTGQTPQAFIELQRLARAQDLLRFSNQSTQEIAMQLGFQSQFYFSRRFKARFGKSPSQYRHGTG
jgi:AraC family transcriptional regulator of arabinose operon